MMPLRMPVGMTRLLTLSLVLAAAPWAAAAESSCDVTIAGDQAAKFHGSSDAPAGASEAQAAAARKNVATSDLWVSEADLKRTVKSLVSMSSYGKSPKEIDDKVAAQLASDPKMAALVIGCGSEDTTIVISAMPKSKYATVPQGKPSKHRIVADREAKPGDFGLIFTRGKTTYELASPGTLELARFDDKGAAGKFSFEAVSIFTKERTHLTVSGAFSLRCVGSGSCKP
jgi:hypothetical protein